MKPVERALIRAFDLLFASALLVLLSPLLCLTAICLRLTGEGQVLYRQDRIGVHGRTLRVLKFTTMLKRSDAAGLLTLVDDPRVLPLGRILRKTKINELPQLFNVLAGDMSLIGRRPLVREHFETIDPAVREILAESKPGLSGIASIVFRDEERLLESQSDPHRFFATVVMPYKAQLDLWYHERKAVVPYLILLFMTGWVVVRPSSDLPWRVFQDLPEPPEVLRGALRRCSRSGSGGERRPQES